MFGEIANLPSRARIRIIKVLQGHSETDLSLKGAAFRPPVFVRNVCGFSRRGTAPDL